MTLRHDLPLDSLGFLAALVLSALLTPVVRNFAVRRRYLDDARSARNVHTRAIPRLGGVALVGAWLAVVLAMLVLDAPLRQVFYSKGARAMGFGIGALAIAALGLVDDLRGLRARYKLAAQLGIALLLCGCGFTVHEIQLPGHLLVPLGRFAVPLTVLWIAGMMNAMNLVDGLDGLAGGVSIIALAAAFIFGVVEGHILLAAYSAALAGAVLGFLLYNFNPASIFMGDTGSLFLGYFLGVALLVPAETQATSVVRLALPVAILGVPIADMLLAILRRALRGRGLFSPDREHLHHRLLARGMTQREAVLTLYGVCIILAAGGLAMAFGGPGMEIIICGALLGAGVSALRLLGFFAVPLKALRAERRRNLELRATMRGIKHQLQHVPTLDDLIESLHQFAPAVSASGISANLGGTLSERRYGIVAGQEFRAAFSLSEGRKNLGKVTVVWRDGRKTLDLDHALAIEDLCETVARALKRVSPGAAEVRLTPLEIPMVSGAGRTGS
jgi:UDP-GlcNAc:undecaprenyl-phosphate/decaprenyl-phosphate GlcNAc-1-phosphate transferase